LCIGVYAHPIAGGVKHLLIFLKGIRKKPVEKAGTLLLGEIET
jgi:hypothetical protein